MGKEKMKLWKKILIVVVILFLIFIVVTLRKAIIITHLDNTGEKTKNDTTNCYVKTYTFYGSKMLISKTYYKDTKYLSTNEFVGEIEEPTKLTSFFDGIEQTTITQIGENKTTDNTIIGYSISTVMQSKLRSLNLSKKKLLYKMKLYVSSKITSEKCNDKECFLLEMLDGNRIWIDKETGIVVRRIIKGIVEDTYYQFNVVTDKDIKRPTE